MSPAIVAITTFDQHYWFGLVSFVIGALAGFQAIHNRYPKESIASAFTISGAFYLFTRDAFPTGIFLYLYARRSISSLFWWSLAIGAGAETVLRSQILLKRTPKEVVDSRISLRGPWTC